VPSPALEIEIHLNPGQRRQPPAARLHLHQPESLPARLLFFFATHPQHLPRLAHLAHRPIKPEAFVLATSSGQLQRVWRVGADLQVRAIQPPLSPDTDRSPDRNKAQNLSCFPAPRVGLSPHPQRWPSDLACRRPGHRVVPPIVCPLFRPFDPLAAEAWVSAENSLRGR
jgi:hypothetical protein